MGLSEAKFFPFFSIFLYCIFYNPWHAWPENLQPQYPKRILDNQFWTLINKCQKILWVDLVLRKETGKGRLLKKCNKRGNKEQMADTDSNVWAVTWNRSASMAVTTNSWIDQATIITNCYIFKSVGWVIPDTRNSIEHI